MQAAAQQSAAQGRYSRNRGYTHYELTNHLGNVLAVITDRKLISTGAFYVSDVLMLTDYYAFGQAMPGRTYNASAYRYGYNAKEKDNELYGEGNAYDFGARINDPRLGRWLSCDPLERKYTGWSTYNSVLNNPIRFVDADGREVSEYPIITITKTVVGTADARVIGYIAAGTVTKTDLYKAVVRDTEDPDFYLEFTVTRDAWTVAKGNPNELRNVAFEPKDPKINLYAAKSEGYDEYPKGSGSGVGALKLTQYGSEVVHAAPLPIAVELGYRTKEAVAAGVMLHVSGYYTTTLKDPNDEKKTKTQINLAASEGCFGICPKDNSATNPSNKYAADVINKIKEQSNKGSEPGKIQIKIEPREPTAIPDKKKKE